MIKLSDILLEQKLNRVHTTKLEVALEKFLPLLKDKEQAELMLLVNKLLAGVHIVNSIPFSNSTKFALQSDLVFHVSFPAMSVKEFVISHISSKNQEVSLAAADVVKALDELCYVN